MSSINNMVFKRIVIYDTIITAPRVNINETDVSLIMSDFGEKISIDNFLIILLENY